MIIDPNREVVLIEIIDHNQCDQIGRFIELWASLWQQLICPNLSHSQTIFVKVSKSIILLVNSFLGAFIDIWQFFLITLILIGTQHQESFKFGLRSFSKSMSRCHIQFFVLIIVQVGNLFLVSLHLNIYLPKAIAIIKQPK